jgi:ribulose bisphosphate carboxylase small subunit
MTDPIHKRFITTRQARIALDNMDDYARMANIDPHGPRGVLEQFIEQVELVEAAQSRIPVYDIDLPNDSYIAG